jgi:PAS domain S-box-containing protein
LVAISAAIAFLFTTHASAAEPKRVLIINSFGTAAPPFTIHSTSFESELVANLGEGVALDEVSLDMARNDEGEMQQAMVEYLEKRQAKWQPDLVVPIGSPAAVFVVNNYGRLFPEASILVVAGNRQFLPAGTWEKNATFVGHAIDIPGFLEDILQVAPATKNIEIVLGATSLERAWRAAFQKAAEPLAGRIKVTYYNDLSFDQMLDRAAKLPPDSYIFFMVLLRDAGGVTVKSDEALQRLHRVANAPINALFVHQLGMGIVGGRLLDGDLLGKEAADVAIRILHGEQASSIPPVLLKQAPPRYDWRELQQWRISEKLLPPGSTVLFREPTGWDRYRAWIVGGLVICLLQGLLIAGLVANLVKRHRAERSLTESEHRFQNVADTAPVLIWMSDTTAKCTFVNKSWLEFTGRTQEEEFGEGWLQGVHPDDAAHCVVVIQTAFAERKPFEMEYRLRRRDGEYRWLLDNGTPRFERGVFLGYIGSCLDITQRRQAELDHQLQATELARVGRVALMGELAASLAHEVNNPLGAMVANASAGQRLLARGHLDNDELRELLTDIVTDGHRAREVIQGIRNMVRKTEATHSLIDLKNLVRDLIRIVRADALARKITVVTEVDPNVGPVMGDRVQLLQVMLNLTMNAFEALSVLRAESRRVVISACRDTGGGICLKVRDHGPGFPGGLSEQLFEPFFSTKAEGTGMGLAIARSIIESHGGTLSAANCDDGGACFTVCLPEAKGASKAA